MKNETLVNDLKSKLQKSKSYLDKYTDRLTKKPKFAIIFGTGLEYEFLKHQQQSLEIAYEQIPNFNPTSTKSHKGKMLFTKINEEDVLLMLGRTHYYEGYNIQETVYPIHLLKEIGIETILLTSSVGGVNKNLKKGELMVVQDHINLTSLNPLIGYDDSLGKRFLSCSDLYDANLINLLEQIANEKKITLKKGCMLFLPGPTFETRAELKAIKKLGGDTIGWSTVLESIIAHYRGTKVLAINCITDSLNFSNGSSLEEIISVANNSSKNLYALTYDLVKKI